MKRQGYNDRVDESLGMRRGKESGKKQSYESRRDESRGMRKSMKRESSMFGVEDNRKAGEVRYISTNGEKYDLDRIKKYECGSKGYPREAFNYKY